MKELKDIRVEYINRSKYKGILCFLANEDYQQGDLKKKKNCSNALSWLIFPEKMDYIVSKSKNIELVCDLEVIRFKTKFKERVKDLLVIIHPDRVQQMVDIVEQFIRNTIKEKYD